MSMAEKQEVIKNQEEILNIPNEPSRHTQSLLFEFLFLTLDSRQEEGLSAVG